jgi:hypothetical protein
MLLAVFLAMLVARLLSVVGMLLASVLTRASHGLLHRGADGIALGLGQLSRGLPMLRLLMPAFRALRSRLDSLAEARLR